MDYFGCTKNKLPSSAIKKLKTPGKYSDGNKPYLTIYEVSQKFH